MSDNLASDVARRLALEGFGTITGIQPTIYSNEYPPNPDDLVAVNENPAGDSEETFGGTVMEVSGITVLVRGTQPTPTVVRAKNIWRFLHRFRGVIEGVPVFIWARSIPFPIGEDENERKQWSCNYIVRRLL